ncbi:MAG TPA: S53 family peptidase [Ktedonobacterales bacterium]|nr:S53 family peptidase [Ktedonobacterales bacterium]
MPKLWTWIKAQPRRRAVQALTLAIVAAVSSALPVLGGASATLVRAQNGPPPLHAHSGHHILLTGAVPNALRKAKRVGVESGAHQLDLVIALQLADLHGLATLLANQQNPKSSQYHHYLTSKDFTSRFAPSAQAVNAVRQFLVSQGLKVTSVSSNRTLIHARGTVAQANHAFGVTLTRYQLGKRTVYGPDRAPQIPDALAPYVVTVAGLDDVTVAQPLLQHAAATAATKATSANATQATLPASGPLAGANGPTQLRGAYDVASLISAGGDGAGQSVGIFELAPYIPGDFSTYESYYGITGVSVNNISVDGAAVTCATAGSSCDNGGVGEADLDLEDVSALAPNTTLDVWTGPNSGQGILDTYNSIVTNDLDASVTTSWGICEPLSGSSFLNALDQIYAQGATQGQTIAAAAGDYGSDDCRHSTGTVSSSPNVDSPASDPYVLGAGGTTLTLSGSSYGSETVWNHGGFGTGGGLSSNFAEPSWQVGAGVANAYSTGEREVPDVAADADPNTGYSVYCTSVPGCNGYGWTEFGGTSAAAPLWAGVIADINSYLSASAHAPLGWANSTIFTLFSNAQTYAPFHDITSGNNDTDFGGTAYAGDYPATTCYDLTTGVGSPDAWNIARDVQAGVAQNGGGACPASPTATNLVQDGGFENTPSGWTQYSSGGFPLIGAFGQAHSGQAVFFPCAYPDCDDRVWQTITVPTASSFTKAQLAVWINTQSLFPEVMTNPPCVDHLYVTLSTTDGTVVPGGQVIGSCVSSTVFGYQYESFDVASLLQAHANQQLVLTLRGTTTNEAPYPTDYTGWFIDDVSLDVS